MQRATIDVPRALTLLCLVACVLSGCLGMSERGHRSYTAGQYDKALGYYEEDIANGTRDVRVYHQAALSALREGKFATAERYFSLALRYGGGLEVARDLANFYVQTSNYASAVRVFQYLLRYEAAPQPVYNNLGTALMYSGVPMDAESYLLIAQQMDPADPVPYVNLGVLYDRYLRNPHLATSFYLCFLSLSQDPAQTRVVAARLRELSAQYQTVAEEPDSWTCGEVYKPSYRSLEDLRRMFPREQPAGPIQVGSTDGQGPAAVVDLGLKKSSDEAHDGVAQGSPAVVVESAPATGPELDRRAAMERAYRAGDHEQVLLLAEGLQGFAGLQGLQGGAGEAVAAEVREWVGIAMLRKGRAPQAVAWLEGAVRDGAGAEAARALLDAYLATGRATDRSGACQEAHRAGLAAPMALACPAPVPSATSPTP